MKCVVSCSECRLYALADLYTSAIWHPCAPAILRHDTDIALPLSNRLHSNHAITLLKTLRCIIKTKEAHLARFPLLNGVRGAVKVIRGLRDTVASWPSPDAAGCCCCRVMPCLCFTALGPPLPSRHPTPLA